MVTVAVLVEWRFFIEVSGGTVCDIGWDMADAAVVCREINCGEPVDALGDAHFGPGSGPIWTNRSTCTGSESTLKNCGSVEWGFISAIILEMRESSAQVSCSKTCSMFTSLMILLLQRDSSPKNANSVI